MVSVATFRNHWEHRARSFETTSITDTRRGQLLFPNVSVHLHILTMKKSQVALITGVTRLLQYNTSS